MALLLDRRGDEFKITECIVQAAASNGFWASRVLDLLLDKRGDEFHITEEVVRKAVKNRYSARGVLKLLLDRRGFEFEITENILQGAARNRWCGEAIMTLLVEKRPEELYAALGKLSTQGIRLDVWEWWESFERDTLLPRLRLESPEMIEILRSCSDGSPIFSDIVNWFDSSC